MSYSICAINTIGQFRGLKGAWDKLVETENRHNPFLDYDWIRLWLDHFGDGNELLILAARDGEGQVKAICPLMRKKMRLMGINLKRIELIGNVYSPIRNIIFGDIGDGERESLISSILKFMDKDNNWDIMDLYPLPEEKFDFSGLEKALKKANLRNKKYFCFGNWYLDKIDFDGDRYIQSRTSNIVKNIKRYRKQLEKRGRFQLLMITDGINREIDQYMDLYYEVYGKSWKEREMDPTFHRDLAKLARDKGWLRLGILSLEGKPLAAQLWLVSDGVAYIVKLAYDEGYRKFIPGVILSAEMMKYVINIDKVKEIDYLIGDEPYKKDWTPERRERRGVLIFNNNVKGQCLAFVMMNVNSLFEQNGCFRRIKRETLKALNRLKSE